MKLVLASRNKKKIAELQTLLSESFPDVEILSLDDVGVTEEIEENGLTFGENALIKARVAGKFGYIGLGDDSGLCVDALDGAPGVYSARYAAKCRYAGDHDDEGNNQCLLENLKSVADKDRTGAFVCAVGCVLPDGREFTVEGRVNGRILKEYHGNRGFGYDPLFFYEPFQKTFAELSPEEKNSVSHRGKAVRLFAKTLKEQLSK